MCGRCKGGRCRDGCGGDGDDDGGGRVEMVLAEGSDKCVVSETAGIGPSYISVPGPTAHMAIGPHMLRTHTAEEPVGDGPREQCYSLVNKLKS